MQSQAHDSWACMKATSEEMYTFSEHCDFYLSAPDVITLTRLLARIKFQDLQAHRCYQLTYDSQYAFPTHVNSNHGHIT